MMQLCKTKQYDGTLEGFEEMIKDLRLENENHIYDGNTGTATLSSGLYMKRGEYYQYEIKK